MKIAFLTSGSIKSSLSYRPLALAKELVKKGHEVYILALRFDKYSHFKDDNISEIEGVHIVRPWQPSFLPFELGLIPYIFSSIIKLFIIHPDIMHVYKTTPVTLGALVVKALTLKPLILDIDDLDAEVMKIENNSRVKISLVTISEKLLSCYADAIIAGSKFLKTSYKSMYRNKQVIHIPNGAEFTSIEKISTNPHAENRIVFIGNINRVNILEPLFYASREITKTNKKLKVIIIGDGLYLEHFKKLTYTLNLQNHFQFLGHILRNELRKYVKTGDIGYCYMPNEPTTKACSSMKVFQYMQYGAIPLVSNVGDLPTYAFMGKAGYIAKSNNIGKLTQELDKALSDTKGKKNKLAFIKTHAKHTFSWSTQTNRLENIYKGVYEKNTK